MLRWFRPRPPVQPAAAALAGGGREIWLGGELYLDTLKGVHAQLRPRRYLEVGTLNGATLALASCASVAIDPQFQLDREVAANKPLCLLKETTSDQFFADEDPAALLGGPIDFAFLDGMHHFEFLLRDVLNTERFCRRESVVLLHDCCPLDAFMTRRWEDLHLEQPTNYPGYWTGDVWKIIPVLRSIRPDLQVTCLDAAPTGLVAITNFDPSNRRLADGHDAIVAEWGPVTLADYGVERLFEQCRFASAAAWRESLKPLG